MRSSPSATEALFAGDAGFAHRGLHGPGVPENSLAAFGAAIDAGAGIECDLRLSRDGFAMVFHDVGLMRMCGLAVATESLHASALGEFRLASTAQRIPWLGDLLRLVAGRVPLLLELKAPVGTDFFGSRPIDRMCRAVAADLKRYAGPVGVMSFDPGMARWFAGHAPSLPRGLVIGAGLSAWRRSILLATHTTDFLAVEATLANQPWVARQRRRGRPIGCWTVRSAETCGRGRKSRGRPYLGGRWPTVRSRSPPASRRAYPASPPRHGMR